MESGSVEANYQTPRRATEIAERAGTLFAGIDPLKEDAVTKLSTAVIEGNYLTACDYDQVLIGSSLLRQYLPIDSPGFVTLEGVGVGSKIRVWLGERYREVRIKGITKSKVDEIDRRVFFVDNQLRTLIGRGDYNVDEIAVRVTDPTTIDALKEKLVRYGANDWARLQTFEEAQPKFIKDIKATFALLGNMISSIGLAVAVITVFIVVFINAITRRKQIGILKGIGLTTGTTKRVQDLGIS